MAYSLFDNILKKSPQKGLNPAQDFLSGFKKPEIQSQTSMESSYMPQKQSISQPVAKKPTMTLFADEKNAFNAMKGDGLSDEEAFGLVKKRREQLASGLKLTPVEATALKQMANDGLSTEESLSLLAQGRKMQKDTAKSDFEEKYSKASLGKKALYQGLMVGAGATEKVLQYGGNILDFVSSPFGYEGFGEEVKKMQEVTQSPEFDSAGFKIGRALPDVALAVSPIGGGYLAGAKGAMGLAGRGAVVGAGFGASQPVLYKGSDVNAEDIAKGAAIGGTIGAAIPMVGKASGIVKRAGKSLYKTAIKPTAQEARQIISTEAKIAGATEAGAKKIKMPVTRADTALEYGITGTEKGIAVKGQTEANKIFKKVINPAIKKSKAEHSIDDIFAKVEQQIAGEKSALRKKELMEGLSALKEDYVATGKKVFTTADLQAEKSMLDEFTPTKIFQGKEVSQGYNQVKNTLANIMREQVRMDLSNVGVRNAQKLYKDYANLSALEDIGVKGITEGGLKGGFGTFWSTVYDKIATPVKTVGGKYIYKLGNGIEYVGPKGMDTLGKYLKSKGYKVVGGNIINLSKNVNAPLIRGSVLSSGSTDGMD